MNIKYYKDFRNKLHQNAELAFEEVIAKKIILEHFAKFDNYKIVEFGKASFCLITNSDLEGKTILFRTELDALPIVEINDFAHKSLNPNVSHKCGHDGHITILSALASTILEEGLETGKVIFLFQSAEETGEGAVDILKYEEFTNLQIDYCFALHNIPGYPKSSIITKEGVFTSASTGYIIKLFGKTSHAAEPENGINPAIAISKIINISNTLINLDIKSEDFTLITPIQINMGSEAFGTSAGYGEVKFTLRAYSNKVLQELIKNMESEISKICSNEKLEYKIEFKEYFFANNNDKESNDIITNSANSLNLDLITKEIPFKWSEDFGAISSRYKGAMFGLGSGEDCPALHNPDYDFPDDIIETGVNMFYEIYKRVIN